MTEIKLLATKGIWYDLIENGTKKFDFRKGYREIEIGDTVKFIEVDSIGLGGDFTGKECIFKVTLVIHSTDFPKQFNWDGGEFTIIQFEKEKKNERMYKERLPLVVS